MSTRAEIMAKVDTVPALPAVVIQLRRLLADPEVDFSELARSIEIEPGLTANILRMANSALYGAHGEISSVQSAITRLGTKKVFDLVLTMTVAPFTRRAVRGYALGPDELWEHSLATALCADLLQRRLRLRGVHDAFTAGMLHDIGKIILGTFIEVDDIPIKSLVHDDLSFDEAEQQVLGLDHAEVGGHLLERWGLPDIVVAATRWHHEPAGADEEHRKLVDLIHVADILCTSIGWGLGTDGLHYRLDSEAVERLGVDADMADQVMCRVQGELEELTTLIHVKQEGAGNVPEPAHR